MDRVLTGPWLALSPALRNLNTSSVYTGIEVGFDIARKCIEVSSSGVYPSNLQHVLLQSTRLPINLNMSNGKKRKFWWFYSTERICSLYTLEPYNLVIKYGNIFTNFILNII
jgi:hypothetical protein